MQRRQQAGLDFFKVYTDLSRDVFFATRQKKRDGSTYRSRGMCRWRSRWPKRSMRACAVSNTRTASHVVRDRRG
jgi:hypothetical protein